MNATSLFTEKQTQNVDIVGDVNSYYLDPGVRRRPDDGAVFICDGDTAAASCPAMAVTADKHNTHKTTGIIPFISSSP